MHSKGQMGAGGAGKAKDETSSLRLLQEPRPHLFGSDVCPSAAWWAVRDVLHTGLAMLGLRRVGPFKAKEALGSRNVHKVSN